MTIEPTLLRELARLEDEERTVLSCYVPLGERGWGAVEEFLDEEEARLAPVLGEDEREFFDLAMALLREFLAAKQEEQTAAPGLAFFASLGGGLSQGVELPIAPEPLLAVDREAVLAPLAFQLDKFKPIGVILVDNSGARLLLSAGELIEDAERVKGDVKNLTHAGGWSQMRYQRRRANQMKDLAEETVARAVELFDEAGVERLILGGRQQMVAAVQEALPKQWAERVIGTVAWDKSADDKDVAERVRPLAEEAEREEAEATLDAFVSAIRRGGLAVAGRRKTKQALEMGAVDVLLLGLLLGEEEREELINLAQDTGAVVEFVPEEASRLAGYGEVGALLRFPIALR